MQVLIYNNKEKDAGDKCREELISLLVKNDIAYTILTDEMIDKDMQADLLFAIGGDGTVLFLAEFANRNAIPIVGINAGKLGFLCEFEKNEIALAVEGVKNNSLVEDARTMIKVCYKDKVFYALNEVYVQRMYDRSVGSVVAEIQIEIDNALISKYTGDGAIISSPTGSTAYSFSLGAPILLPKTNVFTMTPIAAHTFNQRPVVYADDSTCSVTALGKAQVGVFVDGKFVLELNQNEKIDVSKAQTQVVFLRKKEYNFFNRLCKKLIMSGDK